MYQSWAGEPPWGGNLEVARRMEGPAVLPVTVIPGDPMSGIARNLEITWAGVIHSNALKAFRFHMFLNTVRAEHDTLEDQGQACGNPAFSFG